MGHLQAPQMAHHWRNVSRSLAPGRSGVVTRNLSTGKKLWKVDVFYWLETCLFRSKKKWSPLLRQPMCFSEFFVELLQNVSWPPDCPIIFIGFFQIHLWAPMNFQSKQLPATDCIPQYSRHRWPTGRVFAWFNRPSALLYISYIEHENHLHLIQKQVVHKVFASASLAVCVHMGFFAHP